MAIPEQGGGPQHVLHLSFPISKITLKIIIDRKPPTNTSTSIAMILSLTAICTKGPNNKNQKTHAAISAISKYLTACFVLQ
jgi:hypothetical protein